MLYTANEQGHIVPLEGFVPDRVLKREFTLCQDMGNAKAGDKVLMAVTPTDTAQVTELENYLGGYKNWGFGADLVSPLVLVEKETFNRRDFSLTNTFAPVEDRVGRSGAINQIEHGSAVVQGKTEEHALAAFVSYGAENDAVSGYNVRASHSAMITDKLNLNREIRVWDLLELTTNWAATHYAALTTNFKWPAGTTKDPMQDLRTRIQASYQPVTDIFMNDVVAGWYLQDTKVASFINLFEGTAGAKSANMAAAAASTQGIQTFTVPGLPPIHVVPSKKYVSSAMANCLSDSVILANVPQASQMRGGDTMATCLTFRYRGRSGTGFTVNEYVPYGRGLNGGTMLEAGFSEVVVMPANTAGGLISDVV